MPRTVRPLCASSQHSTVAAYLALRYSPYRPRPSRPRSRVLWQCPTISLRVPDAGMAFNEHRYRFNAGHCLIARRLGGEADVDFRRSFDIRRLVLNSKTWVEFMEVILFDCSFAFRGSLCVKLQASRYSNSDYNNSNDGCGIYPTYNWVSNTSTDKNSKSIQPSERGPLAFRRSASHQP